MGVGCTPSATVFMASNAQARQVCHVVGLKWCGSAPVQVVI